MTKSALSTVGNAVKNVFKAIYSLVQEPDGSKHLSLGRVAFWGILSIAIYVWVRLGQDIPATMENFLILIVSYVFGGKVVTGAKDIIALAKKSKVPSDEENDGPEV